MDQICQDPSPINRNKRKFQDEILMLPASKQACLEKSSIELDGQKDNSDDEIEEGSAKGSNSFSEDAESIDSKNELISPRHQFSTSSVNWGGGLFDMDPVYNVYASPSFELDCDNMEGETLEDLICSNGVIPNNFVLSSGRWDVKQETEEATETLTIDKEFEQYFSMLML